MTICLGVSGCQRDEEIVHYRVPRLETTVRADAVKETVRFLGAIVPQNDQLWFFKLVGPDAAVTPLVDPFETLVKSIRFTGKPESPIAWDLPAAWEQHPGVTIERGGIKISTYATIKIKSEPEPLELAVSTAGGAVLDNVNRWRGQIGLGQLRKEQLSNESKTMDVAGVKATLVNMLGTRSGGPPLAAAKKPPEDATKIALQIPAGWTEEAPTVAFAIRQFTAGKNTLVTISSVGGGLALNVNRWRGQAKLPPLQGEKLLPLITQLKLAQGDAAYVDIDNPQDPKAPRILGVIIPGDGGPDWVVKMTGSREQVAGEKANFEVFAKSLRFEKQ